MVTIVQFNYDLSTARFNHVHLLVFLQLNKRCSAISLYAIHYFLLFRIRKTVYQER